MILRKIKLYKRHNKCTFEFTLNLQRFEVHLKKKIFVDLFMICFFINYIVNLVFVIYNNFLEHIIE